MDKNRRGRAAGQRGLTLIELVVVIAIVAILVGLAVPSYNEFVLKSRRTEAKELLYTAAQRLQQYYTQNNVYTDNAAALNVPTTSENGHYTLTIAPGASGFIQNSYAVSAAPAGSQTADTKCGTFTLTNLGVKTVSGTQTTPPCW